jgi:hypothetical protein
MFQTEDDEILVNEVALAHTQVIILLRQVTLLNRKSRVPFLIYLREIRIVR